MNPWPFVIASYALTLVGTVGLAWASFAAMRRAEADAAALREAGSEPIAGGGRDGLDFVSRLGERRER